MVFPCNILQIEIEIKNAKQLMQMEFFNKGRSLGTGF